MMMNGSLSVSEHNTDVRNIDTHCIDGFAFLVCKDEIVLET